MKNKSKFIILALVMLISIIGISYAFFVYYKVGDNSSKLIFGDIYLKMNEGTDTITLTNVFPETAEKARSRTDNQITFTVSGINTTTNKDIWYEVILNEGDEIEGKTRYNPEDLVFDLIEVNEDGTETYVVDAMSYSDINARRIWVNTVDRNTATEVNKTYKLRMWLSEDVFISDTNPNATYDVETFENSYGSVKVSVYGDFAEKGVVGYITYDVNGADVTPPTKQPIYVDEDTTIINQIIYHDLFLGWTTSPNSDELYYRGDEFVATSDITLYAKWVQEDTFAYHVIENLSLTTPDIDGTRFVIGNADTGNENTDIKNFVWYSGKLWRIVGINNDGSIKLVTQGNMTELTPYSNSTINNYKENQIQSWLNNEFLPTLYNADDILTNHPWDYTPYEDMPNEKNNTIYTLNGKVGLLNLYEYMMISRTADSDDLNNNYLYNGATFWTMSTVEGDESGLKIWRSTKDGFVGSSDGLSRVRPCINLVSDIKFISGAGTRTNPYIIQGDKGRGTTSELLNNRISGEYIKFDDVIYRIVGVENGLTKVIMSDYTVNISRTFGDSIYDSVYNIDTGIGKYLYDWYNDSLNSIYKSMIVTDNIVWYSGPYERNSIPENDKDVRALNGNIDYTTLETGIQTISPIGLGYYGEMFSATMISNDIKMDFWLMPVYSNWSYRTDNIAAVIYLRPPTSVNSTVRQTFYLKSDVKIASGSGMPNDPYIITQ